MRRFKRIIWLCVFLCLFALANGFLSYALIPADFPRIKVHTLETQAFDDLIFGNSHGGNAFNASVISGITGRNCYNAAARGLFTRDQYCLLQYAMRTAAPSRVILEFDPSYLSTETAANQNERYLLSCMKPSLPKWKLAFETGISRDFRYLLMPWYFYKSEVTDMAENLAEKRGEAYRSYAIRDFYPGQECREDGFIAIGTDSFTAGEVPAFALNGETVKEEMASVRAMAQYCRERGIEFVVVTVPLPASLYEPNAGFFEEAHAMMERLAGEEGFLFLDYNAEEGASLDHSDNAFADQDGHMREEAADVFSEVFADDLLTGQQEGAGQ